MTQIKELISSLSIKQRIAIVVAVMVAGLSLAGLFRWQQEADFRALYSSLDRESGV